MKNTHRRIVPVDDESETGKLAAVKDVERADSDRAEMRKADEMDGVEMDRDLDRAELDRAGMNRPEPERTDGERHISNSDIESETPVPQGDVTPPSFTAAFGDANRPRAATPHLAEPISVQAGERWQEILAAFVDDPRKAVGDAHKLVSEVMQRMIDGFTKERDNLERQWSKGGDVSTEDLRVSLQNYRAFFARLLPSTDR